MEVKVAGEFLVKFSKAEIYEFRFSGSRVVALVKTD
jgi:hypothetical protein